MHGDVSCPAKDKKTAFEKAVFPLFIAAVVS